MKMVQLGEVSEIVSGGTPKTSESAYWDGSIPWVTPADLSSHVDAYFDTPARTITDLGLVKSGAVLLPPGSVLMSSRAPIGYAAITIVPMATNQGFKSIVPGPNLDAKYIYHWIKAHNLLLNSLGNGATFKEVSKRTVAGIRIPLPPLSEQRRIAAILDKADAIRQKRRQAIAHLDTLTQSIFHDMFGDPAANKNGWKLKKLRDLSLKFSDGPFGSNLKTADYTSSGVQVIRLQNIGAGNFDDTDRSYISVDHFNQLRRHECLPGDILIATLGDPNIRACILPDSLERAINKADCVQMRVDPSLCTTDWSCALLNSPGFLSLATSSARGQTRTRIPMGRIREISVPVPDIQLQTIFSEKVRALEKSKQALSAAEVSHEILFSSLQSRAFRGEL